MTQKNLFIDGQWQAGSGANFQSLNPCTQESVWTGNAATAGDVDQAIAAAQQALGTWSSKTFDQRVAVVKRYQQVLVDHKQEIAETIALETGKPIWESLTEAGAMAGKIDLSIKAFLERTGEIERDLNGIQGRLAHKPHGVIAVFGPYNFPGHLPNGHIVPALLAGNTVAFKPSELTPLVAQKMIDYWQQAELPAGVINLLQGGKETGVALAGHAGIDGLFFTGSSDVGLILQRQLAGTGKILALEMGGNNPLIVWDTANRKAAVYHTLQSAYLTAGQRCTCARRLIVPTGTVGDQFIADLREAMTHLVIGPPDATPAPFIGPVISNAAADQLLSAQQKLAGAGGEILTELKRIEADRPFLAPGLIDVTKINDLPDEEHFGPLLKLIRVDDFDHAIRVANDTRFGLSAGLLSDRREHWDTFYQRIRAGIVNWNRPLTGATGSSPFGGVGVSGNHRPSAYYAADYCAYPVASLEDETLRLPEKLTPGIQG